MKAIRKSGWLVMAAALMMGFTACTNEDLEPGQDSGKKTYTLTVQATKGGDTRALGLENNGTRLNATWKEGETVEVWKTGGAEALGTLTAQSDGASTTLTGSIAGVEVDDELSLRFNYGQAIPDPRDPQQGTLAWIADNRDYAEATVTVTAIDGGTVTATSATFENLQAIVRFTLIDKANGNRLKASTLRVETNVDEHDYTISSLTDDTYAANAYGEDSGDGVVYAAIPGFASENVTLTATVGTDTYSFTQNGVTFVNGKFYNIPVYMVKVPSDPMYSTPLTFEAKTAGAVVEFTSTMDPVPTVEYSTDGITWNTYTSGITLASVGDKVSFRGDNATYGAYISDRTYYSKFSCTNSCYIYGNIMSLISSKGYATATTLSGTYTFYSLFFGNRNIYNHPSKTLVLPATTLTAHCYRGMFNGCHNLTAAPELPATTLAERCYMDMFAYCSRLTTAPELPATTLADECYYTMFGDCFSLTTAPELPATTLAKGCYSYMFTNCWMTTAPELPATTLATSCYLGMFLNCGNLTEAPTLPVTTLAGSCYDSMFSNCSRLTKAPELPATTLKGYCYRSMFYGCTLLEEAPELPATTLADGCYYEMFRNCPNLTTAPELPATTLANKCYYGMFDSCTSLNSVKCLATDIRATDCTDRWLNGVAATGTFTKASGMEDWPSGASGIPENWSVVNE